MEKRELNWYKEEREYWGMMSKMVEWTWINPNYRVDYMDKTELKYRVKC